MQNRRFDTNCGKLLLQRRARAIGARAIFSAALLFTSGCSIQHAITYAPIPVSVVRLPVTVNPWIVGNLFEMDTDQGTEVNAPLKVPDRAALTHVAYALTHGASRTEAVEHEKFAREHFETFKSFTDKETLVFVTVSGGGARAEALGAHTMSLLEQKFNEIALLYTKDHGPKTVLPMISQIDAYSSVSGGSIYVFHIALKFLPESPHLSEDNPETTSRPCSEISESDANNSFQEIACNASPSMQRLGFYTALMYFGFGLPLVTLGTDLDYLDIMAAGLDIFSREKPLEIFPEIASNLRNQKGILHMRIMGNLQTRAAERPLFLFNATAIETGTPFVIAQSLLHVPGDSLGRSSVRLDAKLVEPPRLLPQAVTLEDINSSPAKFPLAFAAMASAAFPIGMEPVPVRKYGYDDYAMRRYETDDLIHLADGGVYDNSGLVSAVDLFDYLRDPRVDRKTRVKRLLLLSINAETTNYDLDYPARESAPKRWYEGLLPFSLNWPTPLLPIRIGALGVKSLELIHYTNKTRAEQIALDHIEHLSQTPSDNDKSHVASGGDEQGNPGSPLFFFPVNLLQLSESDSLAIPGGEALFRRVQKIGTNYTVTDGEDALIAAAAKVLVSSRQAQGWSVGPECADAQSSQPVKSTVFRLDEAFAFALLRAQQKDGWNAPLIPDNKTSLLSQWCRERRP
jgi:hypothetical protein